MAELAFGYHWPPSELDALGVDDIKTWHEQLSRINKLRASKS